MKSPHKIKKNVIRIGKNVKFEHKFERQAINTDKMKFNASKALMYCLKG